MKLFFLGLAIGLWFAIAASAVGTLPQVTGDMAHGFTCTTHDMNFHFSKRMTCWFVRR